MVVCELASVNASVGALKHAVALFLAGDKIAHIRRVIGECLLALTVGVLVDPFALIEGTIWVAAETIAIHQIIDPLTLIHSSICMHVSTVTMPFASHPITKEVRFIDLLAETKAMLLLICHFTNIHGTVLSRYLRVSSFSIVQEKFDFNWHVRDRQSFTFFLTSLWAHMPNDSVVVGPGRVPLSDTTCYNILCVVAPINPYIEA